MKVIVTCGPSYEPVDQVRRLTNFSTGELGVLLSNRLAQAGCEVFCLRGVAATYRGSLEGGQEIPFTTNDDLLGILLQLAKENEIGAVFHAAALCDFKVKRVTDERGAALDSPKITSRRPALTIHLEPASKVIVQLRPLFPQARIVGWKYELAGTRDAALGKAWKQIAENKTDACVLNGAAYGPGFAFCSPPDNVQSIPDKHGLCEFLVDTLLSTR